MNKNSRIRHFFLVLYCSRLELDKILLKYSCRIAQCAYITHDKDVYDDDLLDNDGNYVHRKGEIEKVHTHLLISFYNGHTFSAVKRLFTTENDNPRVEPVNDMVQCFNYLTHKYYPDKYQYLPSDISYINEDFYKKLLIEGERKDNDNIAESIINDMLKGTSPRIMVSRYGRDYVIHMRQYQDVVDEIRSWDVSHPTAEKIDEWCDELVQMGLLD